MFYSLTKFHHVRRRALPRPHGGKNQGPDGDVGYTPPQELGWRLRIQKCKYDPHTNWPRTWETVVRILLWRNEGTDKQRQKHAQWLPVDRPHQEERRSCGVENGRWTRQHWQQHCRTRYCKQQRHAGRSILGKTSSALRQLTSRRGSWRGLQRLLGGTSQTPSSKRQTTSISSRWISFRYTNFSPSSQRERRYQSWQTYGDISSISRRPFSTGERQLWQTLNRWQQWLQNHWVTTCAYTATYVHA